MIPAGARLVCGVSGGADSVCMLDVLHSLSEEMGFSVSAVHVHHGIREDEADGDAAFTEALCGGYGIPCKTVRIDVPEMAARENMSLEEAGRAARRQALEEAASERKDGKHPVLIALAHHAMDNAETVLFQLARGSGLAGFAGIRPVSGGYIHPILFAERWEIEAYLSEKGIPYRTDSTNADDSYARNRIRRHVLPYLAEEINAGAVSHIAASAELAAEAVAYLEAEAGIRAGRYVSCGFIDGRMTEEEDPFWQKMILRSVLRTISPGMRDITRQHINDLISLFRLPAGKEMPLPGGLLAVRTGDGILIRDMVQ